MMATTGWGFAIKAPLRSLRRSSSGVSLSERNDSVLPLFFYRVYGTGFGPDLKPKNLRGKYRGKTSISGETQKMRSQIYSHSSQAKLGPDIISVK